MTGVSINPYQIKYIKGRQAGEYQFEQKCQLLCMLDFYSHLLMVTNIQLIDASVPKNIFNKW